MELEQEIRELFASSEYYAAYSLKNVDADYPAWVVRYPDLYGVAVPYDGDDINESFANVSLYSEEMTTDDFSKRCLLLLSDVEASRNEFASLCRNFVMPGKNGSNRNYLTTDPIEWWKSWKTLLGNVIAEKKPYTVLGELLMYEYLLKQGMKVKWLGPASSSHDITCPNAEYEVKSTLKRYDKVIHVTGQFQLQNAAKRLYLYFCRFEESINGICINDLVKRLVTNQDVSQDELNTKLSRLGYGIGNSARNQKYYLHEAIRYEVDDDFPKITPEMFKTGGLPVGIKQLSYDVDLSLVRGESIDLIEEYDHSH